MIALGTFSDLGDFVSDNDQNDNEEKSKETTEDEPSQPLDIRRKFSWTPFPVYDSGASARDAEGSAAADEDVDIGDHLKDGFEDRLRTASVRAFELDCLRFNDRVATAGRAQAVEEEVEEEEKGKNSGLTDRHEAAT